MFFGFGIIQATLCAWAFRLWRSTRIGALLITLFPLFFFVWDNLRIAAGNFIGFGDLLYALSLPAYWAHWVSGSWLIILCGAILRVADFEFARSPRTVGAFCVLATALMIHDLPLFWSKELYPLCDAELLRYGGTVTEANRCSLDQPLVRASFPLTPVIACFVALTVGVTLWVRRNLPWLAVGSMAMFLTAMPTLAHLHLENLGEAIIEASAIASIWHFTRRTPSQLQHADTP